MDDDFLGGLGGGSKGGSKEFGRSSAESAIGGDIRGLDSVTLITIAAIAGAALIVVAMLFRR